MVAKLENSIPGLLKLSLLGTEQDFTLQSKTELSHSRWKFGCEAVAEIKALIRPESHWRMTCTNPYGHMQLLILKVQCGTHALWWERSQGA